MVVSFKTIVTLLLLLLISLIAHGTDEFGSTLKNAEAVIKSAINSISERWQIKKYPHFLRSFVMKPTSYKQSVNRFAKKVILGLEKNPDAKMVIAFGGSSVTAGHDSPFNASYSEVTKTLMQKSFESLNIQLDIRNVAMGNNPCIPYDLCMEYFAGRDADIVQWEQTYFCFGGPAPLHFVKRTSMLPSDPILLIATSAVCNDHLVS